MILKLVKGLAPEKVEQLTKDLEAFCIEEDGQKVLINTSEMKEVPAAAKEFVEESIAFSNDIQLASRKYKAETRKIKLADGVYIGGDTKNTVLISGPCSVETPEQIETCSKKLVDLNIKILRGGCFKPRTSPYSFQGLGMEGLKLMAEMREKYGLAVITEIRDATHADEVIEYTDIIQIGAKAMYDQGILKKSGRSGKPVLLKRGFGSTLKETVQMAEFVLSLGNPNVMICERGIRTFETSTRFTLDLCAVAWLQEFTNLPVIVDPSHAMGYAYGVPALARAGAAMGIDGLLIESHPNPPKAWSDAAQQLSLDELEDLTGPLRLITDAAKYNLV